MDYSNQFLRMSSTKPDCSCCAPVLIADDVTLEAFVDTPDPGVSMEEGGYTMQYDAVTEDNTAIEDVIPTDEKHITVDGSKFSSLSNGQCFTIQRKITATPEEGLMDFDYGSTYATFSGDEYLYEVYSFPANMNCHVVITVTFDGSVDVPATVGVWVQPKIGRAAFIYHNGTTSEGITVEFDGAVDVQTISKRLWIGVETDSKASVTQATISSVVTFTDYYSNRFRKVNNDDDYAVLKYKCAEDAFGFPFKTVGGYAVALLPVRLSAPQPKQEDKTYTKSTGEVVVLYAKYYKEWDAQTEYLDEQMHDCMMAALSCDELYINGERVTKSDNYSIDWDKYATTDCGEKIAMATFKVQANVCNRNSNY